MTSNITVIGAGIAGACTALALLRDGHRVTLVDPAEPGGAQAASYGNGGWISPGSVLPISMPGLWRKVPAMLADPLGPFAIRWPHLPRLAPWLLRFLAAGASHAKVEAVAKARNVMLAGARERYRALAAEAGLAGAVATDGLLHVYPDRAAFEREAYDWRLRETLGIRWRVMEREELAASEPGLDPAYRLGVLVEDGAHLPDPDRFVAGLVAHAVASERATIVKSRAIGFELAGGRLTAVRTEGAAIPCDAAVICTGIWSKTLARQAGDSVPLESERGYHVVIEDPAYVPRRPIMPSDGKMAVTMSSKGLRVAGQVELASLDASPDWRRADILTQHARRLFPAIARSAEPARLARWMGHRPSTPDGLPSLGPASACRDIIHNFGHGHTGIALAPASAQLVADLVAGREPSFDLAPLAPQRFRGGPAR